MDPQAPAVTTPAAAPAAEAAAAPVALVESGRATVGDPQRAQARPIRRILVANRGEIARRVIRTVHAMGLQAVAIHSDPDAGAPFVRDADLAVPIGGRTSAESYLVAAKVLDAARRSGADALHPGYGFLSEHPDFADAVVGAGLTWIGPPSAAMRAMALKVQAKRLVAAAGVPLVPGAELPRAARAADILAVGDSVGFPLLVKASAGGGGKGMRRVDAPAELLDAVAAARREAQSAFGDPTVFIERYVERGRHVEVQVFGDTHGNVMHLFERECSIQRRHQKVIEESPSPGASPATLAGMYSAAVAAARAIDYVGAGTVEFLVAGAGDDQTFAFLEMNTRLQVEHPVTEAVTGLDLVEWQIRVARGEPLPATQAQVVRSGHAIEARLYAEDPGNDHLPGTGRLERFTVATSVGIRVDTGVESGSVVTPFYDPMLAKVIARGATRAGAADELAACLESSELAGMPTNRESLAAILRSPAFLAGDTTTAFLEEHPEVASPALGGDELSGILAAAALGLAEQEQRGAPWAALAPAGWRNVPAVAEVRRFGLHERGAERILEVRYQRDRAGVCVRIGEEAGPGSAVPGSAVPDRAVPGSGAAPDDAAQPTAPGVPGDAGGTDATNPALRVVAARIDDECIALEVGGVARRYRVSRAADWVLVGGLGRTTALRVLPRHPEGSGHGHDHGLVTPVPGTVTKVLVSVGDRVTAGDTLVILEAMKMEHRIRADADGVIEEVRVLPGDSVDAHHVVAVLEEA